MSSIQYLPGKQPHSCEHRLIFKNIDRVGWDTSIDCYLKDGGYEQLKKALTMEPQAITNDVKASGLRGRGRAEFPTGIKWQTVLEQVTPQKYIACNADEGDPGAFMDRSVLEGDPHSVLEAMAILAIVLVPTKELYTISMLSNLAIR